MEIIMARPPNFAAIVAVFPQAAQRNVAFCYGNKIYSPGSRTLHPAILSHEAVHSRRQIAMGVDKWWDQYLISVQFRLDEELPAHRAEYQRLMDGASRGQRRWALREVAHKLAAPIYGNLVTVHEAKKLIGGADANL